MRNVKWGMRSGELGVRSEELFRQLRSCSEKAGSRIKRRAVRKPKHTVLNGKEREEHQRAGFALHLNLSALCADTATPHS